MQIVFTNAQTEATSVREIAIRHKTQELLWNISTDVTKESMKKEREFDLFEQINQYWAYCEEATQDMIFEVYRRIHAAFDMHGRIEPLIQALRPLVRDLFELHPQADIDYWVRMHSTLIVPSSIHRVFDPNTDLSWTREKTYLEEDYRKLIPMAISMRIMIPVWEEFMIRTRDDISTIFKEYQAFELMAYADVMQCEAMQRLEVFVRDTIPKDRSVEAAVLSGIGSEDFPGWVLAVTVVRRLTGADVRGLNSDATLVTYLYNYISMRSGSLENRIGSIKPKRLEKPSSSDEGNNHSRLEGYKIKQAIAAGDIAIIRHYIRYSLDQALGMEPMTPLSLLNRLSPDPQFPRLIAESWQSVQVLKSEVLTSSQTGIAAWVLSNYISPRALPYLNKTDVLRLIAIAQAYMWIIGHRELAALCSGISRSYLETNENTISDTKSRMSTENLEAFGSIFPYLRRASSKAKATSKTNRSTSMALTSVSAMVENITLYQWTLTLPPHWLEQLTGNAQVRRFKIPVNIRDLLAALVIHVEQSKQVTPVHEQQPADLLI